MNALIREPLLVRAAVGAVIAALVHLLIVFGLPVPDGAADGIATAADAVIALVVILLARAKVTPVDAPVIEPETAPVELGVDPIDEH